MAESQDARTSQVIAATVIGLLISCLSVIFRLFATARSGDFVGFTLDDTVLTLGLLAKIGIDVGGALLIANGLGRHVNTLTPQMLITFTKTQYSGSWLYPICVALVKFSPLLRYRRMFAREHDRTWHTSSVFIYGAMAFIGCWCIAVLICAAVFCVPLEKLWKPTTSGRCINTGAFYYGLQIPNIISDLLLIAYPIYEISRVGLRSRRNQLTAIGVIGSLGTLTLIFDIVRLVVLINLAATKSTDFTYDLVDAAIWTTIEPTVAIATICIPSLRLLFRQSSPLSNSSARSATGSAPRNASVETGDAIVYSDKLSTTSHPMLQYEMRGSLLGDTLNATSSVAREEDSI